MSRDDEQAPGAEPRRSPTDTARERRLAAALRQNLKRRKSQARERRERRETDHHSSDAVLDSATVVVKGEMT